MTYRSLKKKIVHDALSALSKKNKFSQASRPNILSPSIPELFHSWSGAQI